MPIVDPNDVWKLVPGVSVGDIKFGDRIDKYYTRYHLIKTRYEDEYIDWVSYDFPNRKSHICTENGLVSWISCDDELFVNGVDLIGLSYSKLLQIVGVEDKVEYEEIADAIPLEYNKYYMQVWLNKKDVVESVICDGPIEDENNEGSNS